MIYRNSLNWNIKELDRPALSLNASILPIISYEKFSTRDQRDQATVPFITVIEHRFVPNQ